MTTASGTPRHAPGGGTRALRLGSRRSPMAVAQSGDVARLITERTGRPVEIVGITSLGDVSSEQLTQIGGTGVFVSSLRESMLRGEVDFAVHSLKDLPTASPAWITLAAIPERDDPRDALVGRDGAKLADLPAGARIGTGSPRRAAQVALLRADVTCVPIRGNANTRLAKVRDGELDAVVLAYAGLARIGFTDLVTEIFGTEEMLPAPGQGALAVECRTEDAELVELLGAVDHPATRAAVSAERALLAALEAGCSAPVGGYASGHGGAGRLCLDGVVLGIPHPSRSMTSTLASLGGAGVVPPGGLDVSPSSEMIVVREHGEADAAAPEWLGRHLAARMLARGAARLLGVPGFAVASGATTNRDDAHD
ncbi:MAG TPA: hydroxymethylbilane synthase [Trebonia sp.]|nr:hydroxymethylbilane synthase [Trebonia sp.]